MKIWETLMNGASWFLWITNARAQIARLFGFKSQEPTGLFDRMKQYFYGEKKAGWFTNPLESAKWALIKLFMKVAAVIIIFKLCWMEIKAGLHWFKSLLFGPKSPKKDDKTALEVKQLELEITKLQLEKEKLKEKNNK